MSQTGGGELLRADLAPMLWAGEIRLGPMAKAESAVPELMLDLLRPAGRTFYCYDARRAYPLLDPTGSILGAATPTIYALPAGGREMQLQALPVGYNLSPGDYLAFDYTVASVTRRALHRIVSDPAVVTSAVTGKALYASNGCGGCHGLPPASLNILAGANNPGAIQSAISAVVSMGAFSSLTSQALADIAAYLATPAI